MKRTEPTVALPVSVREILSRLHQSGYRAYAVGGCVRDALLGRRPNDWDVTTSAVPSETAACFSDCRLIETGIRHGTLTVLFDGDPFEITTFRTDGEYKDNRHPSEVRFAPRVEDDLSRRDFTVNAMAYNEEEGLIDLFGGREDLDRGIIRCVGDADARFREDGLRILRAIRFASVLDFSIDPATADAVHRDKFLLSNIASERIREEFCKLLRGRGAVRILREYADVCAEFLPEIVPTFGFPQNTKYHCHDVWEHTLRAIEPSRDDLSVRLALLFHDVGKPQKHTRDEDGVDHFKGHAEVSETLCNQAMRRLKFDNETRERVCRLVAAHDRVIPAQEKSVKRLMREMGDEDIDRLMEIKRCDRLSHAEGHNTPSPDLQKIPELVRSIRASDACVSLRDLKINGKDLRGIGVPDGRRMGEILSALLEEVLDDRLPNERETLLRAAEKMKEQ